MAQPRTSANTASNETTGPSGLAVPRYVSLKSDRVHSRQGPGTDHKVLWVYRRAGLPLEVIREFDGWRQVRDSEGAEGWVLQSLISGRRTALIMPWDVKTGDVKAGDIKAGDVKTGKPTRIELLADDRADAAAVAIVEAGVIANIRSCDTRWCYVSVGDYRGYIAQKQLWGVYPNETLR